MSTATTERDLELLARYTHEREEEAFAEIVHRHVDLVYSAALRQVRSPQLAEEVAQCVFTDLARNAHHLASDTVLTAWLYQVTRRSAIDVVRRESRRQLREQIATEMNAINATDADWTHIEPLLDEAVSALDETDRAAVLLRYFENKSLREIGQQLNVSDDAAQKRVSRAVERLREFFTKRGVTVGASGLIVVISANAVQAAPVGLAVTISTAAALTGNTLITTATTTVTKAIAMTTIQKTIVTATVAVLTGAGIYEARQASQLREQNKTLQQQQAPLTEQVQQLRRERDDVTNRLVGLLAENSRLLSNSNQTELLRLRGEVTRLRQSQQELAQLRANASYADALNRMSDDPEFKKDMQEILMRTANARYASLFKEMKLTPEDQEALVRLRVEQQALNQDLHKALLKGGDLTELQNQMAASRAQFEGERKALLGNDRFIQLKDYENTYVDRLTADSFRARLDDTNPLSDDQAKQLLNVLIEERAKNPPLANRDDAENTLKKFDAEAGIQFFQAQEQMDQQVLSRAMTFLSSEQTEELAKSLAENLASQKKNFGMLERLYGGNTN